MDLIKAEIRTVQAKVTFQVFNSFEAASELAHILLNLRHYTKIWDEKFGYENRRNKKHWEEKADEWLRDHTKKQDNEKRY